MRIIVSALLSLSLLAGLTGAASAEQDTQKKYANYKKKKYTRHYARRYAGYDDGYFERDANKLPYGSSAWWYQMDREQRGGRR